MHKGTDLFKEMASTENSASTEIASTENPTSSTTLFGFDLNIGLNPVELTVAGLWLGFGLGFAKSWRTPSLVSAELRRAAAFKAGGTRAAKVGAFAFVYSGMTLAAREFRGVAGPAEVDVPSSVAGGAITGMVFGATAGAYAASVGLLRGGALGFGFGAVQLLSASAIESLEGLEKLMADDAAAAAAAAAAPAGDGTRARELATHLDQLAKRMSPVAVPAPRQPEK